MSGDSTISTRDLLIAAQHEISQLRKRNAALGHALRDIAESLNATRLIMKDDEARDYAGRCVRTARELADVATREIS